MNTKEYEEMVVRFQLSQPAAPGHLVFLGKTFQAEKTQTTKTLIQEFVGKCVEY